MLNVRIYEISQNLSHFQDQDQNDQRTCTHSHRASRPHSRLFLNRRRSDGWTIGFQKTNEKSQMVVTRSCKSEWRHLQRWWRSPWPLPSGSTAPHRWGCSASEKLHLKFTTMKMILAPKYFLLGPWHFNIPWKVAPRSGTLIHHHETLKLKEGHLCRAILSNLSFHLC